VEKIGLEDDRDRADTPPGSWILAPDSFQHCSTSGGLGIRSTKATIMAWESAIGYVSGQLGPGGMLANYYIAVRYIYKLD
jgi:hypothetical protein